MRVISVNVGRPREVEWRGRTVTPLEVAARDARGVTVSDLIALETAEQPNQRLLRRARDVPALPESWKRHLRKRMV